MATKPFFEIWRLIVTGLIAATFCLANPSTQDYLPREQQVLQFMADTIDWYRHLPSTQGAGSEPADLLFLEDNRPITKDIVQFAFDFGRAMAAAQPQPVSAAPRTPDSQDGRIEAAALAKAESKLEENAQQAAGQLTALQQSRRSARGAAQAAIDDQIAEIQSRSDAVQAMLAGYRQLAGLVRMASVDTNPTANLSALVDNLARTVPDLSGAAAPQSASTAPDRPTANDGIVDLLHQSSELGRKKEVIDLAIAGTDALIRTAGGLRAPMVGAFRSDLSQLSSFDSPSLDVLRQQQSQLTSLVQRVQVAAPAADALIKQLSLLTLYRSHLAEYRSDVEAESRANWKALLIRLAGLLAIIATLLGTRVAARRFVNTQVQDHGNRQMLIIGEKALFWLILLAILMVAFAFDLSSVATFLGLLAAGLAVGLHDILLSIGGYLVLVGKFRVRVGDRVQISGVRGEVTRVGLVQFELREVEPATGQATGRTVFFANSYVFVSPATPLFRDLAQPGTE